MNNMKKLTLLFICLSCLANCVQAQEHQNIRKRSAPENAAPPELHDFATYPHIPDVPASVVREKCWQIFCAREGENDFLLHGIMDRVLLNFKFANSKLNPIVDRYVAAIIVRSHKKEIPVEAALAQLQKDVNALGYVIYGRRRCTSVSKWDAIKQELKTELTAPDSGIQLCTGRRCKK